MSSNANKRKPKFTRRYLNFLSTISKPIQSQQPSPTNFSSTKTSPNNASLPSPHFSPSLQQNSTLSSTNNIFNQSPINFLVTPTASPSLSDEINITKYFDPTTYISDNTMSDKSNDSNSKDGNIYLKIISDLRNQLFQTTEENTNLQQLTSSLQHHTFE